MRKAVSASSSSAVSRIQRAHAGPTTSTSRPVDASVDDPQLGRGDPELRTRLAHPQVAGQRQLRPTPDREPLDQRDRRLGEIDEGPFPGCDRLAVGTCAVGISSQQTELGDVRPRRERAPRRTAQHDDVDLVVVREQRHQPSEGQPHRVRDRIALLRPGQLDRDDPAVPGDGEVRRGVAESWGKIHRDILPGQPARRRCEGGGPTGRTGGAVASIARNDASTADFERARKNGGRLRSSVPA